MASAVSMGPLSTVILDEIALEGLEGITLQSLWIYISASLELPLPLSSQLQQQVWAFLKHAEEHLKFYELPTERPPVVLYNRFKQVDQDLGMPIAPKVTHMRYKCVPNLDGEMLGSCEFYKERKLIPFEMLCDMELTNVVETWGNKFIIVASQEQRLNALIPANVPLPKDLMALQYSILEIIGRSRFNGETTCGPCSLLNFTKDSAHVFYIKNKLVRSGLVVSQPFNEKRNDRYMLTTLLMLPRFYSPFKSVLIQMIEKVFHLLKEAPENRMTLLDVRYHFRLMDPQKSFKKFTQTHVFRRFFETQHVVVSPALSEKSRPSKVLFICLRNANISVEEVLAEDNVGDKDANTEEFYDGRHAFVDMPLKDEFYRAVARHGPRGCLQSEICSYLAIDNTTIRQMVKILLAEGLIISYVVDMGRQRSNKYVAVEFIATAQQTKAAPLEMLKNLRCAAEPHIPEKEDVALIDIPMISGRIRPYMYEQVSYRDATTLRQVARKTLIVKTIDEHGLISMSDLRVMVLRAEKEQGSKDEMCQKSLQRLLYFMSDSKILRIYEIMLKYEEQVRLYRYVTHPKISMDHEVLQREMIKLKKSFYLSIEERRLRSKNQVIEAKTTAEKLAKKTKVSIAKQSSKELIALPLYKPPKFLISRYMHEFLFYIVVELNEYQKPFDITEELLQHWQEAEPALKTRECLQQLMKEESHVVPYARDISWRTFIPPLPKYADKPAGWVYFMDVVDRMPLSLFNKIFRIENGAEEHLLEYLTDPVRQHYLMLQLPVSLQCQISRIQLQKVYTIVLKTLNNMGLVQVSERQAAKDPLIIWVFLNRCAQILDTTSTEASYVRVNPERDYPATMYTFASLDDIHQYWTHLQRICVFTKLGFRRGKHEKIGRNDMHYLGTVDFDEAPLYDTGNTPGDHLGAAGLSTHLLAHMFRNWSWLRRTGNNPPNKSTPSTRAIGRHLTSGSMPRKKHGKLLQHGQKSRLHTVPVKALPSVGVGGIAGVGRVPAKKSYAPRDAIDRDALKNMRTLRVSWCPEEVEMLKIARAVYMYVAAPVPALSLLTVGKICRDILRRTIGSRNKTMQACVRRIQFMVKTKRHLPEVPTWLHVLQTSEEVRLQYGEHFLQKLKQVYTNRTDFCEALAKHFILIMLHLYKIIHGADVKYAAGDGVRFAIPDTIVEFNKGFQEREPAPNENGILYANPSNEFDLQVAVVMNVLHSSLCCSRDKTPYNSQAFEIYKSFSEEVLQNAFQKARCDALVVTLKRKEIQLNPTQVAGPAYLLSQRYRMRLKFLKIPYCMYDGLYNFFERAIGALFAESSTKPSNDKQLELKSPHVGQLFFITEGLARAYWQISVKMPVNILTVDTDQSQNINAMDRIFDHYHSILDNAPQTEYSKSLETEPSEKQVRVKFHPANLSYKTQYTPYDVVSKLPSRQLHFFCALDHLQQEVDMNFSKLQRKDDELGLVVMECPFNCIMKQANYMNAIERIVQEKRTVLDELSEIPTQKLLSLVASVDKVVVQPGNLLSVVQMLESLWREKELPLERKDLGKLSPTLRTSKPIDWQELCKEIVEFNAHEEDDNDKNDDYEPTLNKEERIVRAQDVFVVNLPTLIFNSTAELCAKTETVLHNGLQVPKTLLETEIHREAILQKITDASYWKYTEHTFETLKPKLKDLKFNAMEQQHLEEVHNFIDSHKLGATVGELLLEFPYEQFLMRALQVLEEFYLIKRVGVATFMYVHKSHIRPWVVHTFHIKRLERENLGAGVVTVKRKSDKLEEQEEGEIEVGPSTSKKAKLTVATDKPVASGVLGKRVPKSVKRFEGEAEVKVPKTDVANDVVVMRPQPWMRLNGSINRRVLDRWLGSILTECISRSGCSLHEICLRFPHMIPVDVLFLLEILRDLQCLHFTQMQAAQVDIFTEYEDLRESIVTGLYDPEFTYITTHVDAVMRMATFIGNKKYNTDFI